MIECPKCGNQAHDTAVFCDQCGTRLKEPPAVGTAVAEAPGPAAATGVRCSACGYSNVPGELFCENCGVALEALEPEPAALAEPAGVASPAVEVIEAPVKAAPEGVVDMPAPTGSTCPACGASVGVDDDFCDNCGATLKATEAPAAQPQMAPIHQPTLGQAQDVVAEGPRLVVADTGAEIPLPAGGEILVGRVDPVSGVFPDIDLTPHGGEEGGVSRKHLRIRTQNGGYTVEDLNSTNFTWVNHHRLTPGASQPVEDGDELRLGRVRLLFKTQ